MNKIINWMAALRHGHRRTQPPGGYSEQDLQIAVEPFKPDLGQDSRLQRLRNDVSRLGAESFDEATGHPFDERIIKEGEEWDSRLDQQYQAWKARASQRLDQAETIYCKFQQLLDQDRARLEHTEMAVETAVLALTGQEPEPPTRHARVIRIIPEQSSTASSSDALPNPDSAAMQDGTTAETDDRGHADPPDGPAALLPSKVSKTELRRLLEPQDANRVPRWGDTGFRDGTLLAGRPRNAYLHALALLLAAGADIGAFTQTVELVLPQADWVVWIVVSGLTAVVLYIAHMIGVMLREANAASKSAEGHTDKGTARLWRGSAILACAATWLAVGVLAFWVRYTVPLVGTVQLGGGAIGSGGIGSGGAVGSGATSGATEGGKPLQAAAIFFGLYLATGIVAIVGGYYTHNPYRGRYAAALRAYRKAGGQMSTSIQQFGMAFAAHQRQQAEIDAAEQILASAKNQNKEFTDQLKQVARIEIAALIKDPAVTDAFFKPNP